MRVYRPKLYAALWLLGMLGLAWLSLQNLKRDWLETGFLALLPQAEQRPEVANAIDRHNQAVNRKVVWLVGAANAGQAVALAETVKTGLAASGLFADLTLQISQQQYRQSYQQLFAYRYQLLDSRTRQSLQQDPQRLVQENLETLYSPLGQWQAANLERDPLLLFSRYFAAQNPLQLNIEHDAIVVHDGPRAWALLIGELPDRDLKLDKLEQLLGLNQTLQHQARQQGGELLATGLPLFTAYGAHSAQQEISTIGIGSTLGVVLLLWLTFRSPRPLLLCCLAVASGLLAAWSLSLQIFPKLHIMTLVFGSSLIGVVVDYALHFFCDGLGLPHWTPRRGLSYVLPGIGFGLLTSLLGYAGLGFSPFPGLREMAVFSALGLVVSWLTVVMLFPVLLARFQPQHQFGMLSLAGYWQRSWPERLNRHRLSLSAAFALLLIGGLSQLQAQDDVRLLQSAPTAITAADAEIRRLLPIGRDNQFVLVTGANPSEWYQNEQRLLSALAPLREQAKLRQYDAVSRHWPDPAQQAADYRLLQTGVYRPDFLQGYMRNLGFEQTAIDNEIRNFAAAAGQTLSLDDWLASANANLRQQWLGCNAEACRSIVSLTGISDLAPLEALAELPGVTWVDHVSQLSELFQRYRQRVTLLLAGVCGLILSILIYRLGWRHGLQVMAVPVLAMLTALATLGWLGELFTLFNLFALLLVLEVAVDYAVFFRMAAASADTIGKRDTTTLAVALSAFTTLLGYGLLATSSTAIVHAFGVTLAAGVGSAFLLAPLIGFNAKQAKR
ncbi:MMPL family transporter [Methylomonas sp. DH-1]|uniref:MMPL family transporter n=1 Tax=Methylomonas sp. (strain DH-1) TaxID=1727196 RepID=UPI0007C8F196|nr:MMPL family transporter [Methylomonas sp. DH-1]ANE56639.1 transporter [Methylomonas sp. DH-1]